MNPLKTPDELLKLSRVARILSDDAALDMIQRYATVDSWMSANEKHDYVNAEVLGNQFQNESARQVLLDVGILKLSPGISTSIILDRKAYAKLINDLSSLAQGVVS